MPTEEKGLVDAVRLAMNAEAEAAAFYADAAENTRDESGRAMFNQLVSFERSHYERLKELLVSIEGKEPEQPVKASHEGDMIEAPSSSQFPEGFKTDIDAVTVAIEAEKRAQSTYISMADSETDPQRRELFKDLAEEEDNHRRILEDQFMALSNTGHYTWAE